MTLRPLAVAAIALAVLIVPGPTGPAAAADFPVTLIAFGFEWHRNSPGAPSDPTILAAAGDNLNLTIENQDGSLHTFVFPHFGVDMDLTPGTTIFVNISTTASDAGLWQFWCRPHSAGVDDESHTGMVGWFNLQAGGAPDTTAPEILHTAAGSVEVGSALRVEADVTDDVGVQTVRLNYTDVSGATQNVTMSPQGGVFVATIPAQATTGNITYFIYAEDTSANTNTTTVFTVTVTERATPPSDSSVWIALGVVVAIVLGIALILYLRRRKK